MTSEMIKYQKQETDEDSQRVGPRHREEGEEACVLTEEQQEGLPWSWMLSSVPPVDTRIYTGNKIWQNSMFTQ